MPIGFAIFITAVIVSVLVILIYHFVIIGTSGGNDNGGGDGYNYNSNIAYLNTLTEALAESFKGPLNTQLNYNNGDNFPDMPNGGPRFYPNLAKP